MTPLEWGILAFIGGLLLLVAELALPTHGVLGIVGVASLLGAIVLFFNVSAWLGLATLAVCAVATPIIGTWLVTYWPRTRVGRTLVLQPIEPQTSTDVPMIQIGQIGKTLSELRPMGMCEFAGRRVEVIAEVDLILPGKRVQVVNINNRRPTVRAPGE